VIMNWSEQVAGGKSACSKCHKRIGEGETYYHEYIDRGYYNFCVICAIKEMYDRMLYYTNILRGIQIYKEKPNVRRKVVKCID